MIPFILKSILCSALFLLVYKLLLEKENLYRFNRLYLLFSIVFSFIVPLITFHSINQESMPLENIIFTQNLAPKINHISDNISIVKSTNIPSILLAVYLLASAFFIGRFFWNLRAIFSKTSLQNIIPYKNAKIVLLAESLTPHSFYKYIFLNKAEYEKGNIANEILTHELAHVQQRHSFDIVFIQLIQAFFWINPCWFFYKKFMQLNHEFLADEAVINNCENIAAYQYLLIEKSSQKNSSILTSQFNFLITKKRLIMMTKNTSSKMAFVKLMASIISVVGISFLLSNRVYSQVSAVADSNKQKQEKITYGAGATAEQLNEYDSTLKQMASTRIMKNGKTSIGLDMRKCDKNRMAFLYQQMNAEQQASRDTRTGKSFILLTTAPPKKIPTAADLKEWTNPKMFGVWIDDRRVANSELNKYKPEDISLFYNSKLYGAAKKGRIYSYQVDLYTNSFYEKLYSKMPKRDQ